MTTIRQLERRIAAHAGDEPSSSRTTLAPAVVALVAIGSIIGLAVAMEQASYDIWGAFWIAPLLLLACLPVARSVANAEGNRGLAGWLMGAALLKIVIGSCVRYANLELVYEGSGDANRYDRAGAALAGAIRSLDYQDLGKISGTRFIEVLTAHVYAVTGATKLGGFMVFSTLGFLGLVAFYRAFVVAFPEGDPRRYRRLLFLFPSMWFWPSSIGKEAFMLFCLGLAAYGLATAFHGGLRGLPIAALALWGAGVVRPHILLLFLFAAAVGMGIRLLPTSSTRLGASSPLRRSLATLLLVVLVGGVSVAAVGQFEAQFGLDRLDVDSAEGVLEETTRRSAQGGSEFSAPNPSNPLGYAVALVTVLFRPFPFEAASITAAASAVEGLALLLVALAALPGRLLRLPRLALRRAYVGFAGIYVLTFVYAFSAVENFGILARQRTQVLPLVFVLLAVRPSPTGDGSAKEQDQLVSA